MAEPTDDKTQPNTDTGDTPESTTPAEANKTENMIPQSRFKEVINEKNELKKRLEALEKAQEDEKTSRLAADNKYQELYETAQAKLQPLEDEAAKATRFHEALKAGNDARLQRIPEENQNRIPPVDDPIIMGLWLDANADLYTSPTKPIPPKLDGGAGGGASDGEALKLTQAEIDVAKASGMSLADFAKGKAGLGKPFIMAKDEKET